jgi:fibro-slime domain-containing protein
VSTPSGSVCDRSHIVTHVHPRGSDHTLSTVHGVRTRIDACEVSIANGRIRGTGVDHTVIASTPRIRLPLVLLVPALACSDSSSPRADDAGSSAGILSVGGTAGGSGATEPGGGDSGSGGSGTGGVGVDDEGDDAPLFDIGGSSATHDMALEVDCDPLVATIRDFSSDHPDFETYSGQGAHKGLVMQLLGVDQTPDLDPSYGGEPMITSAATFAQWYHDVAGINQPFPLELVLEPDDSGLFVYDSSAFFPIDNMGFGNQGNDHNFHFTTEVHTSFTYKGGEEFTFRGDDDLWMFVNARLVLDIGGLHSAVEDSIQMDTLGLVIGETYAMDIFHAERHTNESNFRIETTIECFVTPPPVG